MKNIISLLALVFVLNSCTTVVFMNRTVPPKLTLEKQPARIVFRNNFNYQNNTEIKEKHEVAYKTGIEEFAEALVNVTPSDKNMAVFTYDSNNNYKNPDVLFDTLLMKSEIISLCEMNRADFLLSLDSLNFNFDWEVIREEDEDGSVSKTKNFYLFSYYYLTLYDLKGAVRERTCVEKSCFYTSRPTLGGLITINPNLAKAINKIKKMAEEAGIEYIGQFYPSLERNVMRKLYTGKAFKETNTLIKSQHYNEAIKLLQDMANAFSPKLAAKAQHNLDVAKELKKNNVVITF